MISLTNHTITHTHCVILTLQKRLHIFMSTIKIHSHVNASIAQSSLLVSVAGHTRTHIHNWVEHHRLTVPTYFQVMKQGCDVSDLVSNVHIYDLKRHITRAQLLLRWPRNVASRLVKR